MVCWWHRRPACAVRRLAGRDGSDSPSQWARPLRKRACSPRPRSSGRNEYPSDAGIRRNCAAARGADNAARCPNPAKHVRMGEGETSSGGRRIQPLWKLPESGLAVPSPVRRERVRASALSSAERVRVVLLEIRLLSGNCFCTNPYGSLSRSVKRSFEPVGR
jgi:hypothetical protein